MPQGIEVVYDGRVIATIGTAPAAPPVPTTGDWPTYTVVTEPVDPSTIASDTAVRVYGVGLDNWDRAKLVFRFSDWPEWVEGKGADGQAIPQTATVNLLLMYNDGRVPGCLPAERKYAVDTRRITPKPLY